MPNGKPHRGPNRERIPIQPHLSTCAPGMLGLARVYGERKRNFVGQHFWARGFFVNTIGRDASRTKLACVCP